MDVLQNVHGIMFFSFFLQIYFATKGVLFYRDFLINGKKWDDGVAILALK
jgi:hypothetical protein